MAELPAEGKFHTVDDAEADNVIEASTHMILHSEAIGRVLRNMYGRLQALEAIQALAIKSYEAEIAELKAPKKAKRSVVP